MTYVKYGSPENDQSLALAEAEYSEGGVVARLVTHKTFGCVQWEAKDE